MADFYYRNENQDTKLENKWHTINDKPRKSQKPHSHVRIPHSTQGEVIKVQKTNLLLYFISGGDFKQEEIKGILTI